MTARKIFLSFSLILQISFPALYAGAETWNSMGTVLLPKQTSLQVKINYERQRALTASTVWSRFTRNHGAWSVQWNEATYTPHRAFGPAINIHGYRRITQANVENAARRFLRENQSLLKVDNNELKLVRAFRLNGKWYVTFRQVHNGVEVLLSEVELRIFRTGKVMSFGVDYYSDIRLSLRPALTVKSARQHAVRGLSFNPLTDTIRWRYNRVRKFSDQAGAVTGLIQENSPTDPFVEKPFQNLAVKVGSDEITSDAEGHFNLNIAGQEIVTLVNGYRPSGTMTVAWNGRDHLGKPVPSEIYFCRIKAGSEVLRKNDFTKVVLWEI